MSRAGEEALALSPVNDDQERADDEARSKID
jgi:hypothetical protein